MTETRTLRSSGFGVILLITLIAMSANANAAQRRALLIGINDYGAPEGAAEPIDRDLRDLMGAVNDVGHFQTVLEKIYKFDEADIVTLKNREATHDAILLALDQHLVKPAAKGDILFFYYAGHGARAYNSLSDEPDQMDESLVPADTRTGVHDIHDKELRRRFNAILDRGARLTIVIDACNSGSAARGLSTGTRPRGIKPDRRDLAAGGRYGPRPDRRRGALILAATQDFDRAWEIRDTQGQFHGAFSWALLRAMIDSDSDEPASETFLRARARLRGETPFQEPVIAGTLEEQLKPLLGARRDRQGNRSVVAVEKVLGDGTVQLQGGWVNGLSIGTELSVVADRPVATRLRITAMLGADRSEARVEPARTLPAAVQPGALLEVVGWTAPPGKALRVWMPRIGIDAAALAVLARRMCTEATQRGIRWIADPVEATPTHLIRHGSNGWELIGPAGFIERLGDKLTDPVAGVRKISSGSSLFVQLPAPAGMFEGISVGPGFPRAAIELTDYSAEADYILVGRLSKRHVEYSWMRPVVRATDRRKTALPLRSDWFMVDGTTDSMLDATSALRTKILQLRRIHAWSSLESPREQRWPYRLQLRRVRTGEIAKDVVIGDENYEIVLRTIVSVPPNMRSRYTYVFVIDCHGKSSLLFPRGGSVENRLPFSTPPPREIALAEPGSFEIGEPWGMDTYFLLTTDAALQNPTVLEWDGVKTRSIESPTAFEQFLLLVDSGNRGGLAVVPSGWSIERVVFESVQARSKSR